MVFVTRSVSASDIPNPEMLAKQYLKDLCTLNEQDFTRKYMLTQADVIDLINTLNAAAEGDQKPNEKLSDSLAVRSQIHSMVRESYRSFKAWQKENNIDSSKIQYHSCDFELEKKRELPFYAIDQMKIYFLYDTLKYSVSCDEFLFIKSRWIAGEFDGVYQVDNNFRRIYTDYSSDYYGSSVVDTVAVEVPYEEEAYVEEAAYEEDLVQEVPTKKQLKIQKKMDAYYRKIDILNSKY